MNNLGKGRVAKLKIIIELLGKFTRTAPSLRQTLSAQGHCVILMKWHWDTKSTEMKMNQKRIVEHTCHMSTAMAMACRLGFGLCFYFSVSSYLYTSCGNLGQCEPNLNNTIVPECNHNNSITRCLICGNGEP